MAKLRVRLLSFDCEGRKVVEIFDTEQEAQEFAENYGLEAFKTEPIYDHDAKSMKEFTALYAVNGEESYITIDAENREQAYIIAAERLKNAFPYLNESNLNLRIKEDQEGR
jgi:hypothetical protein